MSRPVKPRKRVVETLTEVFRELGYEGASLSRLSEATGLKRASLYHRFPGGKQAMALAVLEHVAEAFQDDVLRPLSEQGDPAARVTRMGERLRSFYADGRLSCLLDTLSVGDADPAVGQVGLPREPRSSDRQGGSGRGHHRQLLTAHVSLQVRSVDRVFLQGCVPKLMSEGLLCRFMIDRHGAADRGGR